MFPYIPLALFVILAQQLYAETLTVYNHARYPIHAGLYYVKANMWGTSIGPAERQNPIITIPARAHGTIMRPGFIPLYNREIIFSTKSKDLTEALDHDAYKKAATHAAGWKHGLTYHIAEQEKTVHCYSEVEWYVTKPIIDTADAVIDKMLEELQKSYNKLPYAQTQATIRSTTDLCPEEIAATSNRMRVAHDTLENLLSISLAQEKTPRIALCFSGGGMRAAMCSYALVAGLSDIGLLNAITYCAALSGSTWFLTDWLAFGQPLDAYYNHFINALSRMHTFSIEPLSTALWPKYIFEQETSIVDLYGVFLANTFLSQIKNTSARQRVTFSSLGDIIKDGSWPFPLTTAIETSVDYHWVTFSPYEIGSDTLHFYIPTWAFGRKFAGGVSIDSAPEQSLGYLMGLWGSALSGSLQDYLEKLSQDLEPLLYHTLKDVLITTGASDFRWASIKVHNPLYGSKDSSYRTRNITDLVFMDAGYAYNIPLPPLVKKERAVDIIIIIDASEDVHNGTPEFRKAIADLSQQGISLPPIDFTSILEKPVNIFNDPNNPQTPTIIYIVPVKQDAFDPAFDPAKEFETSYETAHFSCKKAVIDKLTGLIRFSIAASNDAIINSIKDVIAKK